MLVYLRGGCTGEMKLQPIPSAAVLRDVTPRAGGAGGPVAHQGQVPTPGLAARTDL